MKSYASFTSHHLGGVLELGGPVVLFCLVLVGGFKLVPPAPGTFDLTVRPYSADGRNPIITSGKITIDLDNDRRTASLGDKGEADFKSISAKFRSATIKVLPEIDGYDTKARTLKVESNSNVLELPLTRAAPISLEGTIDPPPDAFGNAIRAAKFQSVKIVVEGENEATPDVSGMVKMRVHGKAGDRVRVRVYFDGRMVYDDYQVLPALSRLTCINLGVEGLLGSLYPLTTSRFLVTRNRDARTWRLPPPLLHCPQRMRESCVPVKKTTRHPPTPVS